MGEDAVRKHLRAMKRGTEINGMNLTSQTTRLVLDWDTRAKLQRMARQKSCSMSSLMRNILHDWAGSDVSNT